MPRILPAPVLHTPVSLLLSAVVFMVMFVAAAGVWAQVSVSVDNFQVDRSPSGGVLGIPRQQVMALNSGAVAVFVSGWQGRNLFLSPDLDAVPIWTDTMDMTVTPLISNADDHTHFSVDRDTIYAAMPTPDGDSLLVKIIGCDGNSLFDVDYSYTRGYRAPGGWGNMTVYRGGAWFIPGTDSLILITRGHDGTGNDYMDVMSFVSADRGRTWSDSIRVIDLIDAQDQTRVGGINFFNGTVSALIYAREYNGIFWYDWNRTTRSWQSTDDEMPLVARMGRGYSGNVIDDTIQFVTCFDAGTSSRDTLFYAYRTIHQTGWTRGVLEIGDVSASGLLQSDLCYIEKSHRLVLFHHQYYAPQSDSVSIYCRYWIPQIGLWSEPTLVSTGRAALDMSPALRVPASHGDVAYISYRQRDAATGNEEIELARVRFSGDIVVDSCNGCQGMVGNIDCSPDGEVTLSDLSELVDNLFISLSPVCCPDEAVFDDVPGLSLSDLAALVDHLFISLRPLPQCP